MLLRSTLALGLAVLPARGLWAEEITGLDADTFLGDLPVFLTVTRLPQEMSETPASVMVIDRDMIEASGAIEVADLLRLVPGFVVGHYHDTDGSRTVVSYYGMSDQYARRLQVLVDGMSVYMPATGGVEWPDLPLSIDDIERIEVVRGPNGAAYGSNSFLGVINIVTRHPQDAETKAWVTAGSTGYREVTARLTGGNDEFQYRLTGGYQASELYRNALFEDRDWPEGDDATITRMLALRADYRASVNDYWTFQAGAANGPRGVGVYSGDSLNPLRSLDMDTDYQQIRWRRILDSDSELQVNLYRNHHRKVDRHQTGLLSDILSEELDVAVPPAAVPMITGGQPDQRLDVDTSLESERWNLEASHRFRLTDTWRLVWGGEYRVDEVAGASYFDTTETFTNRGDRLFFNAEWQPTADWTINLGDLYERNDLIESAHSPRVSVARKLSGPHFLRATASRAYRMPSFVEEKMDFKFRYDDGSVLHQLYVSDGNLDAERIDNLELALGAEAGVYSYELKVFRNEITSIIAVPEDQAASGLADTWRVQNGGQATLYGTELQAVLRPEPDLTVALGLAIAHASGWQLDQINPEERVDLDEYVPTRTFSLLLAKRFAGGDQLGMTYYGISPVRHFAGDRTEGVDTADIHYSHPFRAAGHPARVRVLLRDVLGAYYDFEEETAREYQAFLTLEMAR